MDMVMQHGQGHVHNAAWTLKMDMDMQHGLEHQHGHGPWT
jgi:hypothetical protein